MPLNKEDKIFSPLVVNWLIAIIVGILLPLIAQDYIATAVSGLSDASVIVKGDIVAPDGKSIAFSASVLVIASFAYITALAYQIRFLVILKTHNSTFALITTIFCPVFVWIAVPFILSSWFS